MDEAFLFKKIARERKKRGAIIQLLLLNFSLYKGLFLIQKEAFLSKKI